MAGKSKFLKIKDYLPDVSRSERDLAKKCDVGVQGLFFLNDSNEHHIVAEVLIQGFF